MLRVIGCITQQHDVRLVVLAALLCLFACGTAMSMIARARVTVGRMRMFWIGAAGIVAGCGIWGTHFVAMLAFQPGIPVGYDIGLTVLSVLIATGLCGAGFFWALKPGQAIFGGALTGAAIGSMHYVGMAAVRAPAEAVWSLDYVVASVLIGIVMTALAMHFALRDNKVRSYAIGAGLFLLAIVGMHFTAMAAVTYMPDPTIPMAGALLDPMALAFAIASGGALIVGLGLTGAIVDNHLGRRALAEGARLRAHILELEATKRRLEETSANLTSALASADAANKAKSQFLAAMSHELRTPLNAILGFSEVIGREAHGALHERYREYIGDISKSGVHLLSLINEVLDFSRLDTGDAKLMDDIFDIDDAVTDVTLMLQGDITASNITLSVHMATPMPQICADRGRIRQVLLNLLSNAIKFTPADGSIYINGSLQRDGLAISITDTGIGIALEDIPKALERFGQVDSRLSRKYDGVGLGLPLAKQLMELHGGKLELVSTVAVGTTVTVTIPPSRFVFPAQAAAAQAAAA